jgi:ribosome-binding protein aMBF1 (putative translation factor)
LLVTDGYPRKRHKRPVAKQRTSFTLVGKIGFEINAQRVARGLSQAELARRAGMTQAAIAKLEVGQANPTIKTLERLVGAMNLDLAFGLRQRPR